MYKLVERLAHLKRTMRAAPTKKHVPCERRKSLSDCPISELDVDLIDNTEFALDFPVNVVWITSGDSETSEEPILLWRFIRRLAKPLCIS